MKKILSLVLAALMIFSVLPAAFAADVETIANIEETSEYAEAIKFLNTLKVYKGTEAGDLAAGQDVHRWEAALFLYRAATGDVDEADIKTTTNYTPFKDIDIGDFDGSAAATLGAIAWATQAKITNGVAADAFAPADGILYQDAITMIVRLLGSRYTAASYPYGFVTTARELGITEGITGIGLEEEINRGVFAQLLYNAMFVEVDGVSLAEKAFEVGKATVIITASNDFVYEAGAVPVLRADKVRFAAVDAQGEPTGADFHVDAELFGLADLKAANAAVGTLYNIYYKDTMADVLSYECLAEEFWNLGHDSKKLSTSTTSYNDLLMKDKYITIDGVKRLIVTKYSDLNRKQGTNNDPAGSDEMKIYFSDTGSTLGEYNTKYMVASNGNIYLTSNPLVPEYYYSSLIDRYYQIGADGNWNIFTTEEMTTILKQSETAVAGFSVYNGAPSISDYAKATVSAGERVTLRNYRFGIIDWDQADRYVKYDDGSSTTLDKQYTFNFSTNTQSKKTDWTAVNGDGDKDKNGGVAVSATSAKTEKYMDEYTWTGFEGKSAAEIQKAIADGSYVIYYIDEYNKEVEILKVINTCADEDTFVLRGYLRNFNISSNTIGISESFTSAIVPYVLDYNGLFGGMLKKYDKDNNPTANFEKFSALYDKYVELVVVDGKAVFIKELSTTSDYVIIDAFLAFDEEGVKVRGWSTIAEEYTDFVIKSYNGWSVGGNFDYYAYFLSGLFGSTNQSFQSMIPFTTNTIYKVIAEKNGVYDLTAATLATGKKQNKGVDGSTETLLKVNEYGVIEGVNSKGELAATNWEPTAAGDYWLILDKSGEEVKVHQIKDKVNPVVTFTKGADLYVALDDFVLEIDDAREMIANDSFLGNNVEYFMYNKSVNLYNNQNFPGNSTYEYILNMTNVLTNEIEQVKIDNAALGLGNSYWANQMFADNNLVEGGIYKVIDNVLYTLNPVDYETVANYYVTETKKYEDSAASAGVARKVSFTGGTAWATIVNYVTDVMDVFVTPDMVNGTTYHDSKVTIYCPAETRANPTLTGQIKTTGNLSTSNADVKSLMAYTSNSAVKYDMYFIIGEDGTAVAWIQEGAAIVVTGSIATKGAYEMANSIGSWIADTDKAFKDEFTTTYTLNLNTKKAVVTVEYDGSILVKEGETYNGAYSVDGTNYVECAVKAVKDGDKVVGFTSEFSVEAGVKAIKQFVVAVDRAEANADYRIEAGK